MNIHDIIRRPLITEKLAGSKEASIYAFEVNPHANKIEIKQAIEQLFKVKVLKINTSILPGKSRRFGARVAAKHPWKKAIASLKQGDRIEIYEGA